MTSLRPNRVLIALGLIAALALMVGTLGSAAAAGSGADVTASAKKNNKCKKSQVKVKLTGKARTKALANGKPGFRCRKPRAKLRATLRWSSEADFDLWVFDGKGNRGRPGANQIPKSVFSPNVLGGPDLGFGPETFTDLRWVKRAGRHLSFGVCYRDGGNNPTGFTLIYVTRKGEVTVSGTLTAEGQFRTYRPTGGPIPPASFCQT